MNYIHTENLDLQKNGWTLLINEKETLSAKVGDIVKIVIEHISPLDYEDDKPIRSVSHETVWVEIEKMEDKGYIGILKTQLGHKMKMKDGTEFTIGDKLFLKSQNIMQIRNLH